ncbi:MAG: UMP kinase [bacterium]|nr:UMP kinase [bacterium]
MTAKYKRIMLKVTGESLLGKREFGIDFEAVLALAEKIKKIKETGVEIAIVIGGGNIYRGASAAKFGIDRSTGDYMGMLATVMNGMALEDALNKIGVQTRLQSALSMPSVAERFIRKRAIHHLEKGRVVILAAGTGNPYVTTDTGASLHALELHCEVLMKATKVDGVYDKDPTKNSDAKLYRTLNFEDALHDRLEVMDSAAMSMAMENDLIIHVFDLFSDDNLLKAVQGDDIGTIISNKVKTVLA